MKTSYRLLIPIVLLVNGLVFAQDSADLIIKNVTLIDGTGNAVQNNAYIYVKDGRIFKISSKVETIKSQSEIDGSGKYLIPGLFEGHFHIGYEEAEFENRAKQLIHFGVTSVLIPGADNRKLLRFKSRVKNEGLTSATIYHTSLMTTIEGRHPLKTYGADKYQDGININLIKSEEDVPRIVNEAKADSAIAVKLMIDDGPRPPFVTRIPEKLVSAISQKAHESNLKFFAHVSDMTEVEIAVDNNADALMHFTGVQVNWKTDAEYIQKMVVNKTSWVSTGMIAKSFFYPLNKEWTKNSVFALFQHHQTDYFEDADGQLEQESRAVLKALLGSDQVPYQAMMTAMMKDLKKIHDTGVNVVAGTDVGGRPYILPGISLHEEMQLFAMGGFTPLEIIKCATLNTAKMLDVDNDYGSIEEGKVADMVLLNKNPLEDISNTLSINAVFKNGKAQQRIQIK